MALRSLPGLAVLALSCWATTASAQQSSADYYVHSLPGAPANPPIKMHAGHIEVTPEHNGNIFFWHFQNQHIAQKQRTVIWLNGGPGCSSEDGALMEIGPYRVKDDHTLEINNGSWNEFANLLFVDNPVGTGFSYVDTDSFVTELDVMAQQFVVFLEKFYALFPEYEHDDIYFAGESFAGQHIPYIAREILNRNKRPGTKVIWNVKGLIIGNGWISPVEQYDAYLQYAYAKGLVEKGSKVSNDLQGLWRNCKNRLATGVHVEHPECESVLQNLLDWTAQPGPNGERTCYNMYDVRLRDVYPACGMNWPPDLQYVTPYLRRRDVVKALHINENKQAGWTECNGAVGAAFRAQNSPPSVALLPDLLAEIPIVLFSGAEDLICNHLGTEALIGNMQWNGGKGFELSPGNWAPRRDWTFEGQPAGFWQEARNLTYVLFYNSSHMVPFDLSRRSRDMLDRFMAVDISSIGGSPTDSRLDGEKGPNTSANATQDDADTQRQLQEAKWEAYRKSGEIVLVIVVIAAAAWGYFIWRDRRKRQGYQGLGVEDPRAALSGAAGAAMGRVRGGLESFRHMRTQGQQRDVEAGDFDESELDDLHVATPTDRDRYSVGGDSDDEEDEGMSEKKHGRQANGSRS